MDLEDTFQLSQVVEYTNYDLPLFPIDLECFDETGYPPHPMLDESCMSQGIILHVALCMGVGPQGLHFIYTSLREVNVALFNSDKIVCKGYFCRRTSM